MYPLVADRNPASAGDCIALRCCPEVGESTGTGSGGGGGLEEDVTFNFEKSTQTYTPTATNGTVTGPPITVCWDTKNNVAC